METLTGDLAVANDDAANRRIGTRQADSFAGQGQRVFHKTNVVRVHGLVEKGICVGFGVERHQVVDLLPGADEANGEAEFA
jgi:hypothetical protein